MGGSTNLMQAVDNANQMTHWLATQVLGRAERKERALCVARLVGAGTELLAMGNYNGVMQVVSALSLSAVKRLKVSAAMR